MPSPADELNGLLAAARSAGVPLFQFLGGPTRHKARVLVPSGQAVASAADVRAVLIDASPTALAEAKAAAGAGRDFAVRCPASLTAAATLSLARAIQPLAPLWLSHPVPATLRRAASQTQIPAAASANHLELMRDEAADLLLLDLPALGIRESIKLATLAETHYIGVVLANTRTAPWTEAALHLAAALPNFLALEAGPEALREGFLEVRR